MEIRISKTSAKCAETGRAFVHEEPVHSVVRLDAGALVREDYCEEAWNGTRTANAYSVWVSKYYDPRVAEQEPAEVFSPLRQLFYESLESEDRSEGAKAFLAAQLLRRQKVFRQIKESSQETEGARVALFADRIGNRLIEVHDPNFTYAEIEAARTGLLTRLSELENPKTDETGLAEGDHGGDQEDKHD